MKKHSKILIVDDAEINRSLLSDMLSDDYDIIEASNGLDAVSMITRMQSELSLVLLDIVMPKMDGFEVLAAMNRVDLVSTLPVIIISSETSSSYIDHAYDLGAAEYISRPFDEKAVKRRIQNIIMLYSKQKHLEDLLAEQMLEKEKSSLLMVEVLSHLVEFRNGESGLHVLHIRTITEALLKRLARMTDRYSLPPDRIALIANASALHDIGKISIPEHILNKPGKLTPPEFDVIKTHSVIGAEILERSAYYHSEPLIQIARDICRWHHERYDGRGYPDGLAGEGIPIAAQVVALADVYDALISTRVYKPAYTHEKALEMILAGECGVFNPLLLDCIQEAAPYLTRELKVRSAGRISRSQINNATRDLMRSGHVSNRTLALLEQERTKYQFFASMCKEIQFELDFQTNLLSLSEWGAEQLGLPPLIPQPEQDEMLASVFSADNYLDLCERIHTAKPENPIIVSNYCINVNGAERWFKLVARPLWVGDEQGEPVGVIGKLMDINEERLELDHFRLLAQRDSLTDLYNRTYACRLIRDGLQDGLARGKNMALMLLDMDFFKNANDAYGHVFGDSILKVTATRLRSCTRGTDVVARYGGDEFLVFMEYGDEVIPLAKRVLKTVSGDHQGYELNASIGIALAPQHGKTYEELFHCADQALYAAKHNGRARFCLYDDSMADILCDLPTPPDER